jgi:hypothetical protein
LNQILLIISFLLAQAVSDGPPAPKAGPPALLPPGLPIDDSLWILWFAAIAIAAYYFYNTRKASKLSN